MASRPKLKIWIISTVFCVSILSACVHLHGTAKPNPYLSAQYIVKGKKLESKGSFSEAHEQYKLALTVDHKNALAESLLKKSKQRLSQLADEHFQLAQKYRSQKKFWLSRKALLTALKYQPTHTEAYKMLNHERPFDSQGHVVHTVQKGETLAVIAQNYYGDYKKYPIIKGYNKISKASRVSPGRTIKIPDLGRIPSTGLRNRKTNIISGHIRHTIQTGQSVSKLAQHYYGDKKKYHLITEYNGIVDPASVKIGDRIKIPKVAGLPFNTAENKKSITAAAPGVKHTGVPAKKPAPASTTPSAEDRPEPDTREEVQAFETRQMGITLYKEGKFEDAVFELNQAMAEAPDDDLTRTYLHKAYLELGHALLQQKDFHPSAEAFKQSLKYNPQCAQCEENIEKANTEITFSHRRNGVDHFSRQDYPSAIEQFEKYLHIKPDDAEVQNLLSEAYYQRARVNHANGHLKPAIKDLASALQYNEKCGKCTEDLNQVTDSFKETHYNKGVAYFAKEQMQEAIDEWNKVYAMDPGYKNVEQNLHRARNIQKNLKKIIDRQKN